MVRLVLRTLPWRLAAGLDLPMGVDVLTGDPPRLEVNNRRIPIKVLPAPRSRLDADETVREAMDIKRIHLQPLVIGFIDLGTREKLEQLGISYLDNRGSVHLVADGVYVHSPGEQRGFDADPGALGAVGIRGVQELLETDETEWTVTGLSERASISAGQAQRVMQILERHDLLVTSGRGPKRTRRVPDRTALLDWLALQPAGRRPKRSLQCAIDETSVRELALRLHERLKAGGLSYAVTGTAAASIEGAGPTRVLRSVVRIAPQIPLSTTAHEIGAMPVERAPNLLLWTDVGRLGTYRTRSIGGVQVAPAVRVYLDLLSERRGEDLAAHYRELVLGY